MSLVDCSFRSEFLKISIRCPDAWVYDDEGTGHLDIPVFGPNDLVGGSVSLSPQLTGRGKLNINVRFISTLSDAAQPNSSRAWLLG